ncbi:MAG: SMI1/KNR4 family protein [Verrucomicrobiota bacterium]
MKYLHYYESATKQLDQLGIEYEIIQGEIISIDQMRNYEELLGFSLPKDYKDYLLEMGDGFSLRYETPRTYLEENIIMSLGSDSPKLENELKAAKDGHYNVWGLNLIEDSIGCWECDQDELSEENILQYLDWNAEEYLNECRRRRRWFPIAGIGGGGETLNLDCNTDSGSIRYHDIRRPGDSKSAYIADSLDVWIAIWTRYTFSDPTYSNGMQGFMNSICYSIEGKFPWTDMKFLPQLKNSSI